MHKALHPAANRKITVAEHISEFGNDHLELYERARCPICKQRMVNRAASSPGATGHFAHMPMSGYCPTKVTSGMPYLGLPPRRPDTEHGKQVKSQFANQWEKHFVRLNEIVNGLHFEEFKKVILLADQERIWEYANLNAYQLPYIFSTLMDYPSTNSFKYDNKHVRRCWFRCWFDASVERYDDLWIHRAEPHALIRAWYKQPHKGKPKLDDIINFHAIDIEASFLDDDRRPSEYVIRKLAPWVDRHFHVLR